MAEIKVTLKRINEKGRIAFEVPAEIEVQEALRNVLRTCRDKYNDYVSVTFKPPYKPRTTGKGSQNHHLNGHIMQICNVTGNDYETIKYCIKMTAAEQYGYPVQEVADGDLHLVLEDQFFQLARTADQHRQAHGLVAPAEFLNGLADARVLRHGGVADQAQREVADQLPVHVARLRAEVVQRGQRAPRQLVEALPLGGQAKAAAAAFAQREAQAGLERGELAADGGLAHAQQGLRGRHAASVDDGQEDADQPQVEVGDVREHRVTTDKTLTKIDVNFPN